MHLLTHIHFHFRLCFTLLTLVASATGVWAQHASRRQELEQQRAAKAAALKPFEPTKWERRLLWVENSRLTERLFQPHEGVYPRFGGLTKGAGFALGAGYRQWFWREQALFNTSVLGSFRNYWQGVAEVTLPKLARDRVEVGIHAIGRYWPRERFYGLGRDSLKDDRVSFLREGVELRADAAYKPRPWLRIGALTAFRTDEIGEGHQPGFPSIEESFTEGRAPGLTRQPDFVATGAFVDLDTRDQPKNVRSGGHLRLSSDVWHDRQDLGFSFRNTRAEALFAVPIFDKKRVFVVRAIGESVHALSGNVVPFYAMPTLGGSNTLRGFSEFRYRDTNVFLLNAEYRWEAFAGLDMALFGDWGDVAGRWSDLDASRLKSDYGLGFRFNTFRAVFLRFDIARSREEGVRFNTAFSGAF